MKYFSVITVLLGVLLSGCAQSPPRPASTAGVDHVVLLWLQEPDNLHHKQQIIEAVESLRQIPGVASIRVGEALKSERRVVDDSFSIGIHMLFTDQRAMERYIAHPDHTRTVEQAIMPFVKRIVIYDFR